MSTTDIAQDLVSLCTSGDFMGAMEKYYSPNIVSIEPMGEDPVANGMDAVRAKTDWWVNNMEVHDMKVTGPWVNGDSFVVGFWLDVTNKMSNVRNQMQEYGVYDVVGGKIVKERFFYGS